MNYIESNIDNKGANVRIYYNDYGTGKPIILIHGWPLSKEMWEYQINDLVNSGHRVIAYDRRGFGDSSKPWDGYNYDAMTDDLKALIEQLNLEDITLIGFSMGGGEVVRYFSKYGGKGVTKVVLISSVTPYMLKTDSNPDGVPKEMFDEMIKDMHDDRIAFIDKFGKTFFGVSILNKPLSAPLLDYFGMLCSLASPRATLECAKAFALTDFRSEMNTINVPTLIIHGTEDKTVPITPTGKESTKLIPDNIMLNYHGAPHGLFYTEREKLNKDLLTFLISGIDGIVHSNEEQSPENYSTIMNHQL